MPTTITHAAQGITYVWTLNLDNVQSGVFWDGSPYVVAQSGLKVMNVQITSELNGANVTEGPFRKEYHALRTNADGSIFYGHLYLNGLAKNPLPLDDTSLTEATRANRCIFDSRTFREFNRGWSNKNLSTDVQSSYSDFALNDFMAGKALLENGTGIQAAAGDVFVVAKSNYNPNDTGTYTMPNSGGYPYQKHRSRSNVLGYGTLFVLSQHPASTSFRPPVFWPAEDTANRPLHLLSGITDRLPGAGEIEPTISGASYNRPPSYSDNNFTEFCYGFPIGNGTTYSQFLPLYPAYGANSPGTGTSAYGAYYQKGLLDRLSAVYSDASNTSLSEQNRLKILRSVIQWGIDAFGSIKSFGNTNSGAGQRPCAARPWSVIAGWFLNNNDMRAPETTMLYGSYANRTSGVLTTRASLILNAPDPENGRTRTMKGFRSASIGGTDGYVLNRDQWSREVHGDKTTEAGKKRRMSLRTSLESFCYHKVSGDISESRMLYYANLGRTHNRTFGYGVSGSLQPTAGTVNPATEAIRFTPTKTNTFTGNLAYLRWSQNPFPTGWAFTHDGKRPTIDLSYIRVVSDPGSATSTTQLYRILRCVGDFRENETESWNQFYTLYLDRDWVGGSPSQYAKYEMVPFTQNEIGEIFYVTAGVGFNSTNSALIDANPNPTTIYGGICYPLVLTLYSWMKYAKRELNSGNSVDLDENSTNVHDFVEQVTRKMAYSFQDYNFNWMTGMSTWEMTVHGKWLNLKDPINDGWAGVAFDKGESDWDAVPGVTVWNGVTISSLDFTDEETIPEPEPIVEQIQPIISEQNDSAEAGGEETSVANPPPNKLSNPFGIKLPEKPLGVRNVEIDSDRLAGITTKIPKNTNLAYSTNFRLMIPKVKQGVYFCTEINMPGLDMAPISLSFNRAATYNFYGDKITHGELTIKFLVNEDFSNWFELSDWFTKSINYYGFFRDDTQARMQDVLVDSGQLLILNNKKNPVAKFVFDKLMITGLGNMPMNSAVSDNSPITCDATFQFTSYDLEKI